MINLILLTGWPTLIILSLLIIKRGCDYCEKLKGTVIGTLMKPTIFGWLFGMFSLGIVSTAYMLCIPWYFVIPPIFLLFLVAIIVIYRAMNTWEKEATQLRDFYHNLEKLVKERTAQLEEAHKKAIAHEKEIQKLKDQFVFIAAHELRTPVTAISWGIENVLEEGGKLKPEIKKMLTDVQSSNKRLITLVDDLLNVARIEAGTIKIDAKQIELNEVIEQVLDEMKGVFTQKNIAVEYQSQTPITVFADSDRVKQILINLLSNAVKYNKEKGKVMIKIDEGNKFIKVAVKDTGIGIAQKDLAKVFTKFGRIENKETKNVVGTGLGLFVSKEMVTKMGGQIKVASTKGKGSTFSFTLPKQKPEAQNK